MNVFRSSLLLLSLWLVGSPAVAEDGGRLVRLPPVGEGPVEPLPPGEGAEADAEDEAPVVEELPTVEEMVPPPTEWWLLSPEWYKPWEGSVELGMNGTEGNSQTFNIRAGAKAKHKLPWVEQTYEAVHIDNSSDGQKTALNGFFDGRIVFPFAESKWSYFVHGRVEYDDFRDYDSRLSGDTGVAYDVWEHDHSKLQLRGGVSTSREIGGAENRFLPELAFGADLSHKFDERQKISLTIDYYPAVDDFMDDYRINSSASWEIVVSKAWGLSAKLGVIDRYDNTPQGRRPNDLNYSALMLWAF